MIVRRPLCTRWTVRREGRADVEVCGRAARGDGLEASRWAKTAVRFTAASFSLLLDFLPCSAIVGFTVRVAVVDIAIVRISAIAPESSSRRCQIGAKSRWGSLRRGYDTKLTVRAGPLAGFREARSGNLEHENRAAGSSPALLCFPTAAFRVRLTVWRFSIWGRPPCWQGLPSHCGPQAMTMRAFVTSLLIAGFLSCSAGIAQRGLAQEIEFVKTHLDNRFRSEGVAVADFNNDGQMDIACADVYFAGPDWELVEMTAEPNVFDPKQYSESFVNAADDVDGDGWVDLIVMGFPGRETIWLENPGQAGGLWEAHMILQETNNESPTYTDIDGDGTAELVCSSGDKFVIVRRSDDVRQPWTMTPISTSMPNRTQRYFHGLGIGDINGDGRKDVLIPQGWFEAPQNLDEHEGPWAFHEADLGEECGQMHVFDFDGDGDADVVSSSAHRYGVWWHEQTDSGWMTHTIDESFSQTHSMCFADINGDGTPDIVTGKRWWAHNGGDPGSDEPVLVHWFEVGRENGQPQFAKHLADSNSGIGTQFVVHDVNGDGQLDIVTANKQGVFYLEQRRQ